LISGLSKGVLITEAEVKCGSQITIDCALEQNRNVYVLPGSLFNTMTKGKEIERDGFQIRRTTVENGVPCLTSLDTSNALTNVIESMTFTMRNM